MPEPNQPMRPITNPVLVDAMATFKVDLTNREHERAFLEAALEAKYLIPAMIEQQGEGAEEGQPVPTRIAFQMMTNQKGDKFMPTFTDEIELRKNRKPGETFQVAVMGFMDLYHFMQKNEGITGIVINPFGTNLCIIRRQMLLIGDLGGDLDAVEAQIQQMRAQAAAQQAAANGQPPIQMTVQPQNPLGAAANSREQQQAAIRQAMADMEAAKANAGAQAESTYDPMEDDSLLTALKGCLKKQKAIKKAYIKLDAENGEQYLLIAVEGDEGLDLTELNSAVSESASDYADYPFECVAATSIRAKELVAQEKPFYEKKRFGLF